MSTSLLDWVSTSNSVTSDKKSNHRANIVRITELLPHTNADSLELIKIGGYQVVTRKGQFQVGDLGVYIQPDSIVPQTEPFRFIWGAYAEGPELCQHDVSVLKTGDRVCEICSKCSATLVNGMTPVPERRRRITVRKFRGEWSEGLLLPVSDFHPGAAKDGETGKTLWSFDKSSGQFWQEGDDVSDTLGITHYDPDAGKETESTRGVNESGPGSLRRFPKSLKGWFYLILHKLGIRVNGATSGYDREKGITVPVYDVEAFKNHVDAFTPGEMVEVTEKIHGSNARYCYLRGKMYVGSRTLWKSEKSKCVWRKALEQNEWIYNWCKDHEGHVLYGEVTPTQKSKNYTYNYGGEDGEVKFFVFDILKPDRTWASLGEYADLDPNYEINFVPGLYSGPFDLDAIKKFVDGNSTVPGAKHIREGVVIRPYVGRHVVGLGRLQLKIVSNVFLDKDTK